MKTWIKANVQFYRKGKTQKLGLRGETWQFGNKPLELYQLIIFFARAASEFMIGALGDLTADEMNEQIQKASKALESLRYTSVAEVLE